MCQCKSTILIAENRPETLETNQKLFEREGYRVLTAANPQEALSWAEREVIHLALIDVRLERDQDQYDFSGLLLAAELPEPICKVITTAQVWSDLGAVYDRVFRRDEHGRRLASDFVVVTDYKPNKVLETVRAAFKESVPIDPRLEVKVKGGMSWETMVDQLRSFHDLAGEGRRKERNENRQMGVEQLKDLTCRLFSKTDAVPSRVVFLSTTPGYSPCTVGMVRPTFAGVDGVELAVKFGPRRSIEEEVHHYHHWVKPHIPHSTRLAYGPVWSRVGSVEMAALAYTFVGDDVESVESLRRYYADTAAVSDEDLCDILQHLFLRTCAPWYRKRVEPPEPERLDTLYRKQLNLYDPTQVKKLAETSARVARDYSSERESVRLAKKGLYVQLGGGQKFHLPNPLAFCFEEHNSSLAGGKTARAGGYDFFPIPSQYAITHGDLHASNVIVNDDRRTWLIDFYKTGIGHALRDFAELESDIKFTLFKPRNLGARHLLEKALLAPKALDEEIVLDAKTKPSPQMARALSAIQRLRQLAYELTDIRDTREYYMALLFYALKSVGGFTSGSASGHDRLASQAHALFSAGLICRRLSFSSPEKDGSVFLAHEYHPPYGGRIRARLRDFIQGLNYEVPHPQADGGGGGLWQNVADMIENTDAGFYEITTRNGNVYFELGCALGMKKPYFVFIERGKRNPLRRPALLGDELVHDYATAQDLNRQVCQVLKNRGKWGDWFFFMSPGFKQAARRAKRANKSALLLVADMPQRKNFVAALTSALEGYGFTVEATPLSDEVDVKSFYLKMLRARLVVGCLASDGASNARYANAELAFALGIAEGMGKGPIILQEKECHVLTDLRRFVVPFRRVREAAEILRRTLRERGFKRASAGQKGTPSKSGGRKTAGPKSAKPVGRVLTGKTSAGRRASRTIKGRARMSR